MAEKDACEVRQSSPQTGFFLLIIWQRAKPGSLKMGNQKLISDPLQRLVKIITKFD